MSIYSKSIIFNLDKLALKVHSMSTLTILASSFHAFHPGNELSWMQVVGVGKREEDSDPVWNCYIQDNCPVDRLVQHRNLPASNTHSLSLMTDRYSTLTHSLIAGELDGMTSLLGTGNSGLLYLFSDWSRQITNLLPCHLM